MQQNQTQPYRIPRWTRFLCLAAALVVVVTLPTLISASWWRAVMPASAGLFAALVAVTGRLPFASAQTSENRQRRGGRDFPSRSVDHGSAADTR